MYLILLELVVHKISRTLYIDYEISLQKIVW